MGVRFTQLQSAYDVSWLFVSRISVARGTWAQQMIGPVSQASDTLFAFVSFNIITFFLSRALTPVAIYTTPGLHRTDMRVLLVLRHESKEKYPFRSLFDPLALGPRQRNGGSFILFVSCSGVITLHREAVYNIVH